MAPITPVHGFLTTVTATISSGASLSAAIELDGYPVISVQTPSAWTAAGLSFQGSLDGTTYTPLVDTTNTELTWTVGTSKGIAVDDYGLISGWNYIKLQSGTSAATVNQGGDRAILLGIKTA